MFYDKKAFVKYLSGLQMHSTEFLCVVLCRVFTSFTLDLSTKSD